MQFTQIHLNVMLTNRTCCGDHSTHRESVANALCHGNHVWNNIMPLKTPKVTSRAAKAGLDLKEPQDTAVFNKTANST